MAANQNRCDFKHMVVSVGLGGRKSTRMAEDSEDKGDGEDDNKILFMDTWVVLVAIIIALTPDPAYQVDVAGIHIDYSHVLDLTRDDKKLITSKFE